MARLIRFHKPWGVLSQFTDAEGRPVLADFIDVPGVYPAGRLDRDSEGLLLLTDDGALQARISSPRFKLEKTYLAQVEQFPDAAALKRLVQGVMLRDGPARALRARVVEAPTLPDRDPPIRPRAGKHPGWVELVLTEGRNRQVRRMLAAVDCPVLRLIRTRIGTWSLDDLPPGAWREDSLHAPVSPRRRAPSGRPSRNRRRGTRSSGRHRHSVPASRRPRGS